VGPNGDETEESAPTISVPPARSGRFDGWEDLGEVGVGSGLGIRIEWEYLIVRFDLAYRLHDTSPANDDVFSDNFQGPLLHFGIGQAF
jgi:hypothetical protein